MRRMQQLTAIIEHDGDRYVAMCPEMDMTSQGVSVEDARVNLARVVQRFFQTADASEIESRLHKDVVVTSLDVPVD